MDTPNKIEDIIKKINARYPYSTDRRNYGDMLSGVGNRTEVKDIVGDISTIVFGISREPYYMSEYKDVLYAYMNTCILNNYEFNEDSTLERFCEAYINIRKYENFEEKRWRIVQIAKNRGLSVENSANDIRKKLDEFDKNYNMLNRLPYNSNGYNQQLVLCKKYAVDLLNYKFYSYGIPYKLGWCGNIFTEVEKELEARKNIDNQPKKKNTVDSKTISNIISIIVGGAIFAFFAFIIISGGGPLLVLFGLFIGALLLKCMR